MAKNVDVVSRKLQRRSFRHRFSTTSEQQQNVGSKLGSKLEGRFQPKTGLSCARSTKVLMAHNPTIGRSNRGGHAGRSPTIGTHGALPGIPSSLSTDPLLSPIHLAHN